MNLVRKKETMRHPIPEIERMRALLMLMAIQKYCKLSFFLEQEWEASTTEAEKEVVLALLQVAVMKMNAMLNPFLYQYRSIP